jgi:hypothetical protein
MPERSVPPVPPPPDPVLTRARVAFHTNDDDKDDDTLVEVEVRLSDSTVVAKLSDYLGHFPDHSDAGPFTLLMVQPARRSQLRTGSVNIPAQNTGTFPPFGHGDTWRFNFVVDLLFDDGAHLLARANGVQLRSRQLPPQQSFGIG